MPRICKRTFDAGLLAGAALLLSAPAALAQSDWTACAGEGEVCRVAGEAMVRYGADGRYAFRLVRQQVPCTNEEFGDPAPDRPKACQYSAAWRQDSRYHGWRDLRKPSQGGWRFCASEGGDCWVDGQGRVRFGANGQYEVRTVQGRVECTTRRFGDPLPGTPKVCEVEESAHWVLCANEGETCRSPRAAKVRYGANGRYAVREVRDSVRCVNGVFGDPVPDVAKQCDYLVNDGRPVGPPVAPSGLAWEPCANEHGACSFQGPAMLRYGTHGRYAYREAVNGLSCTNEAFGADPAPDQPKRCERLRMGR